MHTAVIECREPEERSRRLKQTTRRKGADAADGPNGRCARRRRSSGCQSAVIDVTDPGLGAGSC